MTPRRARWLIRKTTTGALIRAVTASYRPERSTAASIARRRRRSSCTATACTTTVGYRAEATPLHEQEVPSTSCSPSGRACDNGACPRWSTRRLPRVAVPISALPRASRRRRSKFGRSTSTMRTSTSKSGTQLVTTQKAYLDAEWAAALAVTATQMLVASPGHSDGHHASAGAARFESTDPAERLARVSSSSKSGRTPAALVATASVVRRGQRFRRRGARSRRGDRAGAGVGGGALRARQAVAAVRRHGQGQRVVPARRRAVARLRARRGRTSAARSASSIGRTRRWPPSSAPSPWTRRVRRP